MSNELKIRMRMNKRRVLPQSRDMVLSYNKRNPPETISEHNDPLRIEWTPIPSDPKHAPEYITGKEALRIPDNSNPRYKLYWPIRHGWVNELDYNSKTFLWHDVALIIRDAVNEHLGLSLKTRKDWTQYGCVFVIPDLYDRKYVTTLLGMGLSEFSFGRVCFFQESLAASFGAGFSTACIVDIGAQKTSICCVEEGMCIENSRVNLKMGGQDITETFVKMLLYNHFPYADINLKRRYDFLLAEELKQKYCTMTEADITVQLFDFHLRVAGQDTRKYTFKAYDEVVLAPLGLFKPAIFDDQHKLEGRRKLIDRSYDIYEGAPNDPTSAAQAEILTTIAPHLAAPTKSGNTNGTTNGGNGTTEENGYFDNDNNNSNSINSNNSNSNGNGNGKVRPQSFNRIKAEREPTPRSTPGSPVRDLESTPQPASGTPAPGTGEAEADEEEEKQPLSISHRDDILPIHPLPHSILTSITHASRSSSAPKVRDFLGGIMLVGGSSLIPGLASHLEESLQAIRPGYAKDILIGRPPRELDAQVVAWKGGSVFGRMGKTNDSWVGGLEYERLGERVLGYKCMWAW
jgi:actin-related protein 8